jgi:glutathione S-transferase
MSMQLYHSPFDPLCRFLRLSLAEYGVVPELLNEDVTQRRPAFLALNPACTVPVLVDGAFHVSGVFGLMDYLEETLGRLFPAQALMPLYLEERIEVRRLVEWMHAGFHRDVSLPFAFEMIDKRFLPAELGGGAPDMVRLRAARASLKSFMGYFEWLCEHRAYMAGATLSYADLAVFSHLSLFDYFGDIDWLVFPHAAQWYARIKSRPCVRGLLSDRVVGMPPVSHYTNLDF